MGIDWGKFLATLPFRDLGSGGSESFKTLLCP